MLYLWSTRGPGGGELSLSVCAEVTGKEPPVLREKIGNPRVYAQRDGST